MQIALSDKCEKLVVSYNRHCDILKYSNILSQYQTWCTPENLQINILNPLVIWVFTEVCIKYFNTTVTFLSRLKQINNMYKESLSFQLSKRFFNSGDSFSSSDIYNHLLKKERVRGDRSVSILLVYVPFWHFSPFSWITTIYNY